MFKLQSKYKSMDINKNLEQYEFCPRQKNRTNYQKSFSEDKNLSLRDSIFNSNIKIRNNSNIPPIYFFRKVTNPYKYSITSIPEYLIKTNEEKRFVEKLYKSIDNDKEKTVLKNLLDKRNQNIKKDYYKPEILDVHNVLRYKPKLYPVSFIPEAKIEKRPKNIKLMKNFEEKNNGNNDLNSNNDTFNEHKKNLDIKIDIPYDNQVRYKYKVSDIFNLHNNSVFTNKSAEKYLFKNNYNDYKNEKEENKFYTTSESKSDWIPNKINQKKMGTNSSVEYNIITPMYKGQNRFITATELNKDNFYNESPSFRRIKSISEFIDLTRVSATNTLGCFNRKNKIPNFKFKNMVATDQADEFYTNRNLIEKSI